MKAIVEKFKSLRGSSYVCVKGYGNKYGEIANHTINVNVNIENAKKADLETLQKFPAIELQKIATTVNCDLETAQQALNELITSAERNLSGDNTTQSKAQQEAYINIGNGMRLKATNTGFDLYITGFANNKHVIVEGEKPMVNSRPKTLVKKAIQKKLKMSNFRNFKISNADSLTVTGDTIQVG